MNWADVFVSPSTRRQMRRPSWLKLSFDCNRSLPLERDEQRHGSARGRCSVIARLQHCRAPAAAGHAGAVAVYEAKGNFSHWAPLTVRAFAMANSAAPTRGSAARTTGGSYPSWNVRASELTERGACGVPLGRGGACQNQTGALPETPCRGLALLR